jgi:hypothetical protein
MIVVQDGSGARIDFDLEAPRSLRLRLEDGDDRPRRVQLVPYRWWPELLSREVASGQTEVEFAGLGGPFCKGLIFVSDASDPANWELKAAFDLDRSEDVTLSCAASYTASRADVSEAECLLSWRPEMSHPGRLFFSMLTPVALFWRTDFSSLLGAFSDIMGRAQAGGAGSGGLRGYGASAFLPVLIESRDGHAWLEWTSAASEFELAGIAEGLYRVRSFRPFGHVTFARGLVVPLSGMTDLDSQVHNKIELEEPLSREVMGTVRWENGRPAAEAVVFLQDAANFRRFLQRVATDRNGFFSIPSVPADAQYVAFALPPEDEHAMKNFSYTRVDTMPREVWLDFTLSPHRVVGQFSEAGSAGCVELVREDPQGQKRVVWSLIPTGGGHFEISNVPHGQYVVHALREASGETIASLPFAVDRDLLVEVRWPE